MSFSKYAVALLMFAQAAPAQRERSMHAIYVEDQSDRDAPGGDDTKLDWGKIMPRDVARQKLVRAMLDAGQLTTGQDYREASFIFQHGFATDDFLLAHILATFALAKGDAESRWISAATLDRYLQRMGKAQVFGTQFTKKDNDPYTQEPFNRALVPGKLRDGFCVENDHFQRLRLDALQHNREPDLSGFKSDRPCR
jgi:hypothetical protein